jgi:hypothetical protein
MLNRIFRSALLAAFAGLAGTHAAWAQIIPHPNMSPTPTIPPIIAGPPTPTPPPTPNPAILLKADPQLARAVVRYGQNGVLALNNDRGRFQKVALLPNEVVTITLTLSVADYGKPADVQVLDGGAMTASAPKPKDVIPSTPTPFPSATINAPPVNGAISPVPTVPPIELADPPALLDGGQIMTVSQAGELVFAFRPGADVGMHRISVLVGGNQYFFRFWRQDTAAFNNNATMLKAY